MPCPTPEFITPDWPLPAGVRCLQTTRRGGFSLFPWESFNLGFHVGDDPLAVQKNRALLSGYLPSEPVWLEQVHGTRVMNLDEGGGSAPADAAVSRIPGKVCAIMTADCLPVFFCDRGACVVGIAHAGWRGLLSGVLENTVKAMACPAPSILAWLGPAIGAKAFEVGQEVRDAFLERDKSVAACFDKSAPNLLPGKYLANLYALARHRLNACGVTAVWGGAHCTYQEKARFFSYRRDGQTGRMASLIWLAPEAGRQEGVKGQGESGR